MPLNISWSKSRGHNDNECIGLLPSSFLCGGRYWDIRWGLAAPKIAVPTNTTGPVPLLHPFWTKWIQSLTFSGIANFCVWKKAVFLLMGIHNQFFVLSRLAKAYVFTCLRWYCDNLNEFSEILEEMKKISREVIWTNGQAQKPRQTK